MLFRSALGGVRERGEAHGRRDAVDRVSRHRNVTRCDDATRCRSFVRSFVRSARHRSARVDRRRESATAHARERGDARARTVLQRARASNDDDDDDDDDARGVATNVSRRARARATGVASVDRRDDDDAVGDG